MRARPNPEDYHEEIGLFLDIIQHQGITADLPSTHRPFLFELQYRALRQIIRKQDLEGIGDLNSAQLDLTQDFNAPFIALAGQQINVIKGPENYHTGQLKRRISKALEEKLSPAEISLIDQDLSMQHLQETAAFTLLDMYLGVTPRNEHGNLLDNWHEKGDDWKTGRCAFYRYLMYSGFVQVDETPKIQSDYIPRSPLLTKLADRFITHYNFREDYQRRNLEEKTGESVDEFLNPERMATEFLRFNGIED